MAVFHNHCGLNITRGKLQIVEVIYREKHFFLENVDEEYFNDFLSFDVKETKFISILQSAFNELVIRKPLSSRIVSISLPNDLFRIVKIPYEDTLIDKDLTQHFKWELSVLFPNTLLEDFIIQEIKLDKSGYSNEKAAIVVGVLQKHIKAIHKFCVRNNLGLKFVDNAHIASNSFIYLENSTAKNVVYLSLYIYEKNFSLMILYDNFPVHFSVKKLESASDIIPSLSSELDKIEDLGLDLKSIQNYYAAGDCISDNFLQQVKEVLNISFVRYNPFKKLKLNPNLYENEHFTQNYNSFSAAAGIALRII